MAFFVFPPSSTFLHRALKTATILILSHTPISPQIDIKEDRIEAEDVTDQQLQRAVHEFVKELIEGQYGLRPLLRADAQRIRGSIYRYWGKSSEERVNVQNLIASGYLNYIDRLADEGRLVKEVYRAFSEFSERGYERDAEIVAVPMLNKLAPEFMESVRILGGVYGSVPSRSKFSTMRLGIHTTCWGIMGLWASLFYVYRRERSVVEYYLFPNPDTLKGLIAHPILAENHKKIIETLRGRALTNFWVALLLTSLRTIDTPSIIRRFEIATLSIGGQREDIAQQSAPLFSEALALFADNLHERSVKAWNSLINLARRALSARMEELGVAEAAMEICRQIVLAVDGVIAPEEVAYHIARFTYLQSNIALEKAIGLSPRDVEHIIQAIKVAREKTERGS